MAASEKLRLFRLARAARRAERKPARPALAAKADDLEAIKKAVDDAASVGGGLWLSYLFVLFYIAIAAGAVTHQDLLLQNPVKLPFLNIELPLLAFFAIAPFLLVITHAYALLHFIMLRNKAWRFSQALEAQLPDVVDAPKQVEATPKHIRDQLRRLLPSNIFVQILVGPPELRKGALGFVMNVMAGTTLTVAPLLVLLLLQFQFLPYHELWVTNAQRVAIFLDLVILFVTFCILNYARVIIVLVMCSYTLWLSIVVATIPGEWQEVFFSDWFNSGARIILFNGDVDRITRRRKSLFSNTLVLPGFNIYEALKVDDPSKLAWKTTIFDLRGRHLEEAVFDRATLARIDFSGADLRGGALGMAQLQGALLDETQLQRAILQYAMLQGASLENAMLQGALLDDAELQGAKLDYAKLQGASLNRAELQGASLENVNLQGAWFIGAQLQASSLSEAQLQGAILDGARLQGASLIDAHLQGASLGGAELQGAVLFSASIEAADFSGSFLWRTRFEDNKALEIAYTRQGEPNWKPFFQYDHKIITWDEKAYSDLQQLMATIPKGDMREEALIHIKWLDCAEEGENLTPCDPSAVAPPLVQEAQKKVKYLDATSYGKALGAILQPLICSGDADAIYVLRGLAGSLTDNYLHLINSRLSATGPQAPALVDVILRNKCPISSLLTVDDKTFLSKIKQKAEARFHHPYNAKN